MIKCITGEEVKNYSQYLKTKHWKSLREKILSERINCESCGKPLKDGYQVHHLTYERIGNEKNEDLMLLCPKCHKALHNLTCFDCKHSRIIKCNYQIALVCLKKYEKCYKVCKNFVKNVKK